MYSVLEQREIFHLAFLRLLSPRLRSGTYAIKGGVNLRLFFGSPRYSEDIDLDVRSVEPFRLKEIVMDILRSRTIRTHLGSFQIEEIVPPDIKAAKQTETTQRFKVHLLTRSGGDLFTKIEFSRRRFEPSFAVEAVSDLVLKHYMLPPLLVPHYLIDAAIVQKVMAIADRAATQGRDIFDLHILLPRSDETSPLLKNIPMNVLKRAQEHILEIDYNIFRDTVVDYLSDDDRQIYEHREVWEEMQLRVARWLLPDKEGVVK